ncbi:hypothetical protein ACFV27_37315 [Streptomyces antimycoticus]|uniref:hypothetical protein n=1 Tax=Streptomyces antimycoticus TaxID=68175 RepID=UPI0036B28AF9
MAILAKTVFVRDPDRHRDVMLAAGEEPEPRLAALVTNPEAWEDGKLPAAAKKAATEERTEPSAEPGKDDDEGTKPAATKKAAARPARGRKSAADEGSSS